MMDTLGVWLRQAREAREETLGDVEAATRIKVRFLEMLEAGEFAALPGGEVQVRGFLRIYTRHLELPSDEVLARYDAETRRAEAAPPGAPPKAQPAPSARPTPKPPASRPRPIDMRTLILAGIALVAVVAAVLVGIGYVMGRSSDGEEAAAATATTVAKTIPPPAVTEAATTTPPVVTPTFQANPEGGVTLTLVATEHVWVRVTVDGITAFEGMLATGQTEAWSGQETVVVDTGNGAGLLATVNDQPQGVVGERSQLCSRAWGPTGEIGVP
jgi:cytoskeleton protein RodZ